MKNSQQYALQGTIALAGSAAATSATMALILSGYALLLYVSVFLEQRREKLQAELDRRPKP
jgi:hypothetical protein